MIIIDNVFVTPNIYKKYFKCDLDECQGICCKIGDSGAPITENEIIFIEKHLNDIKKYLPKNHIDKLDEVGVYERKGSKLYTSLLEDEGICNLAYIENDVILCGVEKFCKDANLTNGKPISCHLFPLIEKDVMGFKYLNYEERKIECSCAINNGEIPLYEYLKEPLIRKYGEEWYKKLLDHMKR